MVVVATANNDKTRKPGVVRIQSASGSSFQVRVDTTDGVSTLANVTVHYLVVEEGVYTVAQHGIKMEAVRFNSAVTDRYGSWVGTARSYRNSYTAPVVLGQVMTYNDPDFSYFWACGSRSSNPPSRTALKVGKSVGEDPDTTRADEVIGYIVVEAGSGVMGATRFVAGVGADTVRGVGDVPPYSYALKGLATASKAIAGQTGMDAVEGGWGILYGLSPVSPTSLKLAIDEDNAKPGDTERKHMTEQVAYIVFE